MFKATIQVESLKCVLDVIATVDDEAVLKITPEGISISVVDPANASMVCIELKTIAFVSFDATECEIGIDVDSFRKIIGVAGDTAHITLEQSADEKELVIKFGQFMFVLDLVSNVRNPKRPDFPRPWTASVRLPGHLLKQLVKAAEQVGERLRIGVEFNGEFFMEADEGSHIKQASAVLYGVCIETPQERVQSLYSLDYMQEFAKAVPETATVSLHIGDDIPLLAKFACCDGGKVKYVIAPRIESD